MGTGRREEFRRLFWKARGAEDKQLQPEDSQGVRGGGEGGVTGLSEAPSLPLNWGVQPALTTNSLSNTHNWDSSMVSKATKSKGKLHPWSRKARAIPDARGTPGRASSTRHCNGDERALPLPAGSGCVLGGLYPGSCGHSAPGSQPPGLSQEVVHTASPVGHVTHHHHFGLCEPVGVETMDNDTRSEVAERPECGLSQGPALLSLPLLIPWVGNCHFCQQSRRAQLLPPRSGSSSWNF